MYSPVSTSQIITVRGGTDLFIWQGGEQGEGQPVIVRGLVQVRGQAVVVPHRVCNTTSNQIYIFRK